MPSNAETSFLANFWVSSDGGATYTISPEARSISYSMRNNTEAVTPHKTTAGVTVDDEIHTNQTHEYRLTVNAVKDAQDAAVQKIRAAALNQTDIGFRFAEKVGSGAPMVTISTALVAEEGGEFGDRGTAKQRTFVIRARGVQPVPGVQA